MITMLIAIAAAVLGAMGRYNKGAAFPWDPPFSPAGVGAWFIESNAPGEWSLRPWWKAILLAVGGAGPAYAICPDPIWLAPVVGLATMAAGLQGHQGLDLVHGWSWRDALLMAPSGMLYVAPMVLLLCWVAWDRYDALALAAAAGVLLAGACKPLGYLTGSDPRANAIHAGSVALAFIASLAVTLR